MPILKKSADMPILPMPAHPYNDYTFKKVQSVYLELWNISAVNLLTRCSLGNNSWSLLGVRVAINQSIIQDIVVTFSGNGRFTGLYMG